MLVEQRDIGSVRPYPGNPRNNTGAIKSVADSIKRFGWRQPLVVDACGVLIAGHTRYEAAKLLGLKLVHVHVANLSDAEARAYRLADNRVGEIATWNFDQLAQELDALQVDGADIAGLGWEQAQLDVLLDTLSTPPPEANGKPFDEDTAEHVTCSKCGRGF